LTQRFRARRKEAVVFIGEIEEIGVIEPISIPDDVPETVPSAPAPTPTPEREPVPA
jgi:hypothetical protein